MQRGLSRIVRRRAHGLLDVSVPGDRKGEVRFVLPVLGGPGAQPPARAIARQLLELPGGRSPPGGDRGGFGPPVPLRGCSARLNLGRVGCGKVELGRCGEFFEAFDVGELLPQICDVLFRAFQILTDSDLQCVKVFHLSSPMSGDSDGSNHRR